MERRESRACRVALLLASIAFFIATIAGCSKSIKPDASEDGTPAGVAPAVSDPAVPASVVPAPPPTSYYTYTVKWSGESVSIIAAWYTGDLQNWKILAQANPALNPNLIFPGIKVLIPENIMKTHEPMTKEFVDSFYPKAKVKTPPKPGEQKKDEEPSLFGPK
jgi:LysM repeat protein